MCGIVRKLFFDNNRIVNPSGYIIIDDYQSCYGCRHAVDEFIQKKEISPQIKFDGRGGCYFEKA